MEVAGRRGLLLSLRGPVSLSKGWDSCQHICLGSHLDKTDDDLSIFLLAWQHLPLPCLTPITYRTISIPNWQYGFFLHLPGIVFFPFISWHACMPFPPNFCTPYSLRRLTSFSGSYISVIADDARAHCRNNRQTASASTNILQMPACHHQIPCSRWILCLAHLPSGIWEDPISQCGLWFSAMPYPNQPALAPTLSYLFI